MFKTSSRLLLARLPSVSDAAGGNFGEPVHLIQIVGARPQDEFIDSHVGLTLDRLLHRGIRSRQGTQAPGRKVGIVAVVRIDIAVRMIPSVRTERIIARAHPTRLS